jgi:hypothetical protein
MNNTVSRLGKAQSALELIERRAETSTIRAKWAASGLDELRAIRQTVSEKRRRREKVSLEDDAAVTVLCERSLQDFAQEAWRIIEPVPLVWSWHHDALCRALEAVTAGSLKRLLVNLPPRFTKSTLTSIVWPAWEWASNPAQTWLSSSYSHDLATNHSGLTRRICESAWYQKRWPHLRFVDDANRIEHYRTSAGGHRIAGSISGIGTGIGAQRLIGDDLLKISDRDSKPERDKVNAWFGSTFLSRLNDPGESTIVAVGQRLHIHDIFGDLRERGGWTELVFPNEYEPGRKCVVDVPGFTYADGRTEPGELLWPGRFTAEVVADIKTGMTTEAYQTIYQQNPRAGSGASAFPEFSAALHVQPCPYDPALPICWSLDFNVTPFVTLVIQHKNGVVRVIHEIDIEDIRTPQMVEAFVDLAIANKWDLKGLEIYGDASGSQRRTSASESDWAIVENRMKDWVTTLNVPRGNPPIKDTINAIRAKLLSADGKTTLFVDPSCKRLIGDLESATWPSTLEECHALAALRYFVHTEYPIVTPVQIDTGHFFLTARTPGNFGSPFGH